MSHTIAAVSTGNQVSAIGIIRLSGESCVAVADKVFTLNNQKSLLDAPDRRLYLGTLHDKQGRVIDPPLRGVISASDRIRWGLRRPEAGSRRCRPGRCPGIRNWPDRSSSS